jgi:tRNA 2-selenouridine synthase
MDLLSSTTFIVLCGKTGSGKTLLLQQLEILGYPSINLERIASHRGSAFGNLLLPLQPSQIDFENELQKACSIHASSKYIFIEMKPSSLGKRKLPEWFYSKMKDGILIQLDADKKARITNILNEYNAAGKESFITSLHKLNERLPLTVIHELETLVHSENYKLFIERILEYYDATSNYQLHKSARITLQTTPGNFAETAKQLLQLLQEQDIVIS